MASQLPFKFVNCSSAPPSPTSTSFQIKTHAATDIWRKPGPPEVQIFNAPVLYKSITLSSFQRARVTVSADWNTLYDQGGLVFVIPQADGTKKWIKSGIEFYQDQVFVSTVAADRGADWSLVQTGLKGENGNEVTLEFKKVKGTLWVYVIDEEKRVPIREVTWALSEGDDRECWIGVFVARPTITAQGREQELVVDFKGFELDIN